MEFVVTIGRFCMCLYPHWHSKPIIFPLRSILRHLVELHPAVFLWIFHNIFASSGVMGKWCFADVKYHAE